MRFLIRPLNALMMSSYTRIRNPGTDERFPISLESSYSRIARFFGILVFIFIIMFNSIFLYRQTFSRSLLIANSTLGFSHIYVIISKPERAEYVKPVLKYHNLDYEVFHAYTKDSDIVNTTVSELWAKGQALDARNIWGLVGCWASHRAVWMDALEKRYTSFLVLEDDIDVHVDLRRIIQAGWNNLPTPWDMYIPGPCYPGFVEGWTAGPLKKLSHMACTHGYGIHARIVTKILEWSAEQPAIGIDLQIMTGPVHGGLLEAYAIDPSVIIQRPLDTQHPSAIGTNVDVKDEAPAEDDWRPNYLFPKEASTAEKLSLAYWY
ncbi:hypothetical protein NEOLI_004093 [Neolecta irregularis DAH-3]|uniref:Glycosyl transferase family 25 domain-containing protein n=1 Tax=Neolecta irregularis (strain DAH-3) TaxID=1198029 RepID=A0A1U7LR47_NEOID|nr:hypothetical protein NEOLI_004093 [Neolecta irregularis DAH-3]|eukprot:OLL25053.1 hypothetical protein NEOLI_004093 [Neolecta irregularis DAH-3]